MTKGQPPPPEFRDAPGDVGIVEIFHEFKAEHPSQADGHVGVAGEVEVDLKRKCQNAKPGGSDRQLVCPHDLTGIPELSQIVGDQQFFCQTCNKSFRTGGELLQTVASAAQLVVQILIFDDGAGDELGEQCHEGAEANDAFLRLRIAPVDIDGVAHGLEGIEGNSDGQRDPQNRHEAKAHRLHRLSQKIPVLEEEQDGQIEKDRGCHRQTGIAILPPVRELLNQQSVGVVDARGEQHDDRIALLTPVVEKQRSEHQNAVAQPQGHQIIDQQDDRQKIKQKQRC